MYGTTKPWRTVLPVPASDRIWQVWMDGCVEQLMQLMQLVQLTLMHHRSHQTLARWPNAEPWTPSGYELNKGRWRYEKQHDSYFGHCVDDPDWHGDMRGEGQLGPIVVCLPWSNLVDQSRLCAAAGV